MGAYFGAVVEQLSGERQDAEDDVEAAVVDEDGGAPVRSFLQTGEPVLDVIDVPGPL